MEKNLLSPQLASRYTRAILGLPEGEVLDGSHPKINSAGLERAILTTQAYEAAEYEHLMSISRVLAGQLEQIKDRQTMNETSTGVSTSDTSENIGEKPPTTKASGPKR